MIAYILVTVEVGKVRSVQDILLRLQQRDVRFSRVAVVAGGYDVMVVFEASRAAEIGHVVLDEIQNIDGVLRTITLLELEA